MAVLLLDIGKGALAVALARWLGIPPPWVGAVAVAAVAGHIFPAFHRLRGGKGVATVTGALVCLDPLPALVAAAVFGLVVYSTRYVSLGSIVATAVFPLFAWLAGYLGWTPPAPAWLLASATSVTCLIIFRHRSNVRRLWEGTEHRLTRARQGDTQ
jgi:glycerol-3-phosphate acyltransferase PlsY